MQGTKESSCEKTCPKGTPAKPQGLMKRLLAPQARERDKLLREFTTIKDLMPLLMKRRNGYHWTRQERKELRQQIKAMAHISPYLICLVLPGFFIFLPLLAWWLDRRSAVRKT